MLVKTANKLEEKILNGIYISNAYFAYKDFCAAIKQHDNKSIEETKVVMLLNEAVTNGSELDEILKKGEILYRARLVKDIKKLPKLNESSIDQEYCSGFDKYDSKEPPLGEHSSEGRCNKSGISYLYLANDAYTACAEVKPERSDIISVAEFRIKEDLKIIDFAEDKTLESLDEKARENLVGIGELITNIMGLYSCPTGSDSDYETTQYVADFFRKAGYDGIKYRSSRSKGRCYALFKSHEKYVEFIDSSLLLTYKKEYTFHDLKKEILVREDKRTYSENISIKEEKTQFIQYRKNIQREKNND